MTSLNVIGKLAQIEAVSLSARYFLYAILLAFFRVFWVIGETSGLFGKPPDRWIGDVADILAYLHIAYTLAGLLFFGEVYRRMTDRSNRPIAPLILNFLGAVLMLVFALRVISVAEDSPQAFVTWASLTVNGLIRGGVYALVALGYTLVYGILLMINFAHGEVMMFGAYTGYLAMQFLVSNGERSFESGAAVLSTFVVPVVIGILFLPLDKLADGYNQRKNINFQAPSWIFTFMSLPMRFLVGVAIGYGALVGLGGYAPQFYLLVITIVGVLFVMLIGMTTSMLVSILLERVAYRPLRAAPRLAPLISAIGASIFFQQVALRIFGPTPKNYDRISLLNDPKSYSIGLGSLGDLSVSIVGTVIVISSIALMGMLYFIVQYTKMGKAMRAVAEDKPTAALMGIDVDRVIVFTFMLGASLAGAAGVMLGLRGDNINFRFGFTPGLKAFTAAVLGGIGNIPGAMFGGFFLGVVESLGPQMLGFDFKWQDVIAFSLLVLVLIFRPTGILGERTEGKKV